MVRVTRGPKWVYHDFLFLCQKTIALRQAKAHSQSFSLPRQAGFWRDGNRRRGRPLQNPVLGCCDELNSTNMQRYLRLLAGIAFAGTLIAAPILAPKGHYFVRDGKPFFWLGDTAWTIPNLYTPAEAEEYLDHRARQGFTIINVMMVFTGGPGMKPVSEDVGGNLPFLNWNPATPNESYFKNIDRVLAVARSKNLILAIMPTGGTSGTFVKKQHIFTEANAREYGRWLGRRYKNIPNLIWVNGFDLKSSEYPEITKALAAGLQEGDGGEHLITFHPGGGNSSSYFHTEKWLAYNTIQTWSDYWRIHSLVLADYCRLPVKPVVLAEGAYEEGPEYPSRPITPLVVRKQAWWAFLAGGFHTYGHNDMWRKNPTWRQSLDSPGARQMGILKQILSAHMVDPAARSIRDRAGARKRQGLECRGLLHQRRLGDCLPEHAQSRDCRFRQNHYLRKCSSHLD